MERISVYVVMGDEPKYDDKGNWHKHDIHPWDVFASKDEAEAEAKDLQSEANEWGRKHYRYWVEEVFMFK